MLKVGITLVLADYLTAHIKCTLSLSRMTQVVVGIAQLVLNIILILILASLDFSVKFSVALKVLLKFKTLRVFHLSRSCGLLLIELQHSLLLEKSRQI
jgi:hypothetical protein